MDSRGRGFHGKPSLVVSCSATGGGDDDDDDDDESSYNVPEKRKRISEVCCEHQCLRTAEFDLRC